MLPGVLRWLRVYPDGKRNQTIGSGFIPMANAIKPIVPGVSRWQTLYNQWFRIYCDGRRYKTIGSAFIAMATVIKPMVPV